MDYSYFWDDLDEVIAETSKMTPSAASFVMSEFLHDHRGGWLKIEQGAKASDRRIARLNQALRIAGKSELVY